MDYWEFLIQQEGDQTWLPLETKQVEILEGRYRVAAHTSHHNAPVEIRVSQLITAEMPPRRRVRKRRSQTNDTGLIIIFPYMQLQAGHWEVICNTANVMDDLLGGGWQYGVQLQVLPRVEDDWHPNWSNPEIAPEKTSDESELSLEAHQVAESISQQMVDGMFQGVDDVFEAATAPTPPVTLAPPHYYELHLQQQAYMAEHGQHLELIGHVLSPKLETSDHESPDHIDGELWVQLRDPQTTHVVLEIQQLLPVVPQPTDFTFGFKLPEYIKEVKTRVLLGELALFNRQEPTAALASSTFTITLGLTQLLDQLANTPNDSSAQPIEETFEEEVSIYPGSTEPFSPPPTPPSTLISPDLPLTPPKVKVLVPSLGMTLPPQIRKSEDESTSSDRAPTLPSFPPRSEPPTSDELTWTAAEAALDTTIVDTADTTNQDDVARADLPTTTLPNLDVDISLEAEHETAGLMNSGTLQMPALFESQGIDDDDLEADLVAAILDDDDAETSFEAEDHAVDLDPPDLFFEEEADYEQPAQNDPLTTSFQSLNLQERFWQKLTSLTFEDHQKAADLKAGMQAAGVSATFTPPEETVHPEASNSNPAVAEPPVEPSTNQPQPDDPAPTPEPVVPLRDREVVIYDESEPLSPPVQPASLSLSEQELAELPILPTPSLEVPNRELTAGEMISIGIRIAPNGNRPYIKVWMNDLQTRTLIEDPRLLMHLTPNDRGELETYIRVKVPRGCLELQIAAIAVDMTTLQESRKSIANRRVVPANMPSLSWDEFEV